MSQKIGKYISHQKVPNLCHKHKTFLTRDQQSNDIMQYRVVFVVMYMCYIQDILSLIEYGYIAYISITLTFPSSIVLSWNCNQEQCFNYAFIWFDSLIPANDLLFQLLVKLLTNFNSPLARYILFWKRYPSNQLARFMGPAWGPPGSCRPQVGPM